MKWVFLMTACWFHLLSVSAQTKANAYRFAEQITDSLTTDTLPWKYQAASWYYSFAGHYQQALSVADSQFRMLRKPRHLAPADSAWLTQFKPVPAREYIVQQARNEQVIIINEAHHQPMHRSFVTSLLTGLYQAGYRYLGLEALDPGDSLLNQRGYAVQETGYYTREPQFGDLVRQARQLGFTLFAYETQDPTHNNKEREIDQAHNIAQFMQQHPNGKYLLYCGYEHGVEGPVRNWGLAMAGRLKALTGIDPLTINQEALTEHSNRLYEQADYPAIHFPVPAVLVNARDSVYNGYKHDHSYDIRLWHPPTTYRYGRPGWLLSYNNTRKPYFVPAKKIHLAYPVLVLAYVAGEPVATAVPFDIMELKQAGEAKALILDPGRYTLLIKDEQQHTQTLSITVR